jgi:hypothetical protein
MALMEAETDRAALDRVNRYVEHIVEMHSRLTYRRLPHEVVGLPAYVSDEFGDGLLTLTFRDSQVPPRYLKGIFGFCLCEYLKHGLMSRDLIYQEALYHEPVPAATAAENLHTVTINVESGQVLGYLGMACSPDPKPRPLDHPRRDRFMVERSHDVDLLAEFAAPGVNTHHVFEAKRFIRAGSVTSEEIKARVPLHLLLGFTSAIVRLQAIRFIIGEASEEGGLRHFRLLGFEPVVVEGTTPVLPKSELLWPMHDVIKVKPFTAPVPDHLPENVSIIRSALRNETDVAGVVAELSAQYRGHRPSLHTGRVA